MAAIKRFFEYESCRDKIASSELLEFKKACTEEEYAMYVAQATAFFAANA